MAKSGSSKLATAYIDILIRQEKLRTQLAASQSKLAQSISAMRARSVISIQVNNAKLASDLDRSRQLFKQKIAQMREMAQVKASLTPNRGPSAGSQVGSAIGIAAGVIGGTVGSRMLLGATDAAQGFVQSMFAASSATERLQTNFVTFLKTEERAAQMTKDLRRLADETPFEMPGLARAAQQLLGVGVQAEKILPTLRKIGDAAAVSTDGLEGLPRITRAISQMISKGKIQAEEMLQLAEVGIPAWQILADKMGVPVQKLQEMGRKSMLTREAIDALIDGMGERFGGSMERASQTFEGLMSTLSDTWRGLKETMGKPIFDLAKSGLKQLTEFMRSDQAAAMARNVAASLSSMIEIMGGIISGTMEWASANRELFVTIAKVGAGIIAAGRAVGIAILAYQAASVSLGVVSAAATLLLNPIGLLVTALGLGTAAWLAFTDGGQRTADMIKSSLADGFTSAADTIQTAIGGIIDAFKSGNVEKAAEIMFAALDLVIAEGLARLKATAESGAEEAVVDVSTSWWRWLDTPLPALMGDVHQDNLKQEAERKAKIAKEDAQIIEMNKVSRAAKLENAINSDIIKAKREKLKALVGEARAEREAPTIAAGELALSGPQTLNNDFSTLPVPGVQSPEEFVGKGIREQLGGSEMFQSMRQAAAKAMADPGSLIKGLGGALAGLNAGVAKMAAKGVDQVGKMTKGFAAEEFKAIEFSGLAEFQKKIQIAASDPNAKLQRQANEAAIQQKVIMEGIAKDGVKIKGGLPNGPAMAGPGGPGGN